MALVGIRASVARLGQVNAWLGKTVNLAAAAQAQQVRGLKATYGEPYPYAKPYPYKTKSFTMIHEWFDKTLPRFNENSKIIVVDGPVAVGKAEFAQRLAKMFDLLYVPATPHDRGFFQAESGFDMRSLNELLPESCRTYDLNDWLTDPHPERGTVGRLLLMWYTERFKTYSNALQHLFHTGQGAVIVKSCYSDHVFVEAMKRCGLVTPGFVKYFYDWRDNSICELLQPHLSIYLDVPVSVSMDRIKKRNNPNEVNSKIIMNEQFLSEVEDSYRRHFLPKQRVNGEVVEIDWTEVADELDMDAIAEELQTLGLETEDSEDTKFHDWYQMTEDFASMYRRKFGQDRLVQQFLTRAPPTGCDEILLPREHYQIVNDFRDEHPSMYYAPGWAPELGHKTFFKF